MAGANYLSVSPTTIYLTYNIFDSSTSGNGLVEVIARHGTGLPPGEQDSFTVTGDPVFMFNSAFFTQFTIEIDPLNPPTIEGIFDYIITVTGDASGLSKNVSVNLKVINEDQTPIEDFIYKEKYYIERENFKLEIHKLVNPSEILVPVEINGRVEYNFQNKTDLFDPIIASSLKLDLEASLNLTLEDLYSEEEKTYKIYLYRDGDLTFVGFIKPDGINEDYVRDRWILTVDAFDGLSTLKNITFINDNGITFSGRKSAFEIILNCLKKTGLDLPININCLVYYDDYAWDSILNSIYLNTERFYQNATSPMDCESVLKSILQIFNASLIQMRGAWWIYRPIDLQEDTSFAVYISGLFSGYINYHPLVEIGSQVDGFDIFHSGANQKKSIAPSVQAYRVTYEYGAANSVFSNGSLKLEGSGLNIPGWTVNNPDGLVTRNDDGNGLSSITKWFGGNAPSLLTLNQTVNITEGSVFKLSISFSNYGEMHYGSPYDSSKGLTFSVGVGGHWLKDDGSWSSSQERIYISNSDEYDDPSASFNAFLGKGFATYDASIRSPYSGPLEIVIWRDKHEVGNGTFKIHSIQLSGSNESDIKGREYTGQRKKRISTVTKSNVTVYNGDSISDLIIGTIFKIDADTATQKWYRWGKTESKELLEINAEDNLRLSPRPMLIFEGDVTGYIPFMSLISINNFDGKKFQPLEYSYNLNTNILRLKSKEFSSDYLDEEDFSITITNNYGNETKVTIV